MARTAAVSHAVRHDPCARCPVTWWLWVVLVWPALAVVTALLAGCLTRSGLEEDVRHGRVEPSARPLAGAGR